MPQLYVTASKVTLTGRQLTIQCSPDSKGQLVELLKEPTIVGEKLSMSENVPCLTHRVSLI